MWTRLLRQWRTSEEMWGAVRSLSSRQHSRVSQRKHRRGEAVWMLEEVRRGRTEGCRSELPQDQGMLPIEPDRWYGLSRMNHAWRRKNDSEMKQDSLWEWARTMWENGTGPRHLCLIELHEHSSGNIEELMGPVRIRHRSHHFCHPAQSFCGQSWNGFCWFNFGYHVLAM